MDQDRLRRFEPLYWNARWYGAADTLRSYLDLPPDYVVPLALPHGVDFGHVRPVQDLLAIEPIHWAHNASIAQTVAPHKPALAIPHPFLLAMAKLETGTRAGTVVVGPPPGPVNDERLLALLNGIDPESTTILVKPKPGYEMSQRFWHRKGFRTASLSDYGPPNYLTMARLLVDVERVVGCTFSSLVIFAAAAGAAVDLLRGYRYDCFDLVERNTTFEVVDWGADEPRDVVRTFANGSRTKVTDLAREILGSGLEHDPAKLRSALDGAIDQLESAVYWCRTHWSLTRRLAEEVAIRTGRPGIFRFNAQRWLQRQIRPRIWARDLDEIGLWLDGRTTSTITEYQIPFVAGRTVPGDAVRPYPPPRQSKD